MTPFYLNPPTSSPFPVVEIREDQQHLQLFLSPHQAAASLSSAPAFFDTTGHDQDQRGAQLGGSRQHHQEDDKYILQSRWSDDHHKPLSSSSFQAPAISESNSNEVQKFFSCKREDGDYEGSVGEGSAAKWMPSKMRLMHKMMNSSSNFSATDEPVKFTVKFQDQQCHTNNNIRVCADCNTTSTPLWRSGPQGPKRKARRAMAAAAAMANGTVVAMETSPMKTKMHNKEKKLRTGHIAQGKKLRKPLDLAQGQKKLCSFKNLAISLSKNSALQRVFPQDVEEAAILLMELSCGFIS
ncbi:putative GATA transcription factor 22 isoform X2 [Manihot esculenta]|uniref:putative GATA transcription factor 22 isoform X2 n=1 Tax=Manihot esculenta TaxID=3983 RepID=UPI001CC4FA60|nr:putative GATA transcription factor 22 isoform X2 [Manihot esculenta]